jgi:iron(III) transport system substrate-binding protein
MLLFFLSCSTPQQNPTTEEKPHATTASIRIYSGRSEALVGELFAQAEKELGFSLQVEYGKTDEMVTRMLTEAQQSPADVIFAQDAGHLGALSNRNILSDLPTELFSGIQEQYRDDNKRWLATSGRLRVLVYNSATIEAEELPKSLAELSDPKWMGRIGWAPTNGSFLSHMSGLRHAWGEEKAEEWLKGVLANKPKVYPKNSPQVKAVDEGTLEIGWVNHYYLHRLDTKKSSAKNYFFPSTNDPGNVIMLSGMGIRKGSPNTKNAEKLLKWMTSDKAQQWFVDKNYEYPTIPGLEPHPDVLKISTEELATIPQSHLADIGPTKELLKKYGL